MLSLGLECPREALDEVLVHLGGFEVNRAIHLKCMKIDMQCDPWLY